MSTAQTILESQGGKGHQQRIQHFIRTRTVAQCACQVLAETALGLGIDLGDYRDQVSGTHIQVLAGLLEELEIGRDGVGARGNQVIQGVTHADLQGWDFAAGNSNVWDRSRQGLACLVRAGPAIHGCIPPGGALESALFIDA